MNWKAAHVGVEGDDAQIDGLKLWETGWRRVAIDPIQLPHPTHSHEVRSFIVFEIGSVREPVRFAGAELSANVWGFYVPE